MCENIELLLLGKEVEKSSDCTGIVVYMQSKKSKPKIFRYENSSLILVEEPFVATGTGHALSRVCMIGGMSAVEAVKATVKVDVFSGGTCRKVDVRTGRISKI
jgi:hypothetical protein